MSGDWSREGLGRGWEDWDCRVVRESRDTDRSTTPYSNY